MPKMQTQRLLLRPDSIVFFYNNSQTSAAKWHMLLFSLLRDFIVNNFVNFLKSTVSAVLSLFITVIVNKSLHFFQKFENCVKNHF